MGAHTPTLPSCITNLLFSDLGAFMLIAAGRGKARSGFGYLTSQPLRRLARSDP